MKPTIGRIVLAVIQDSMGALITRPAIIVRVWGETPDAAINVQVFCDGNGRAGENDGLPACYWVTSLAHDPTGKANHSWHWPVKS
jgi:hypothetical protein